MFRENKSEIILYQVHKSIKQSDTFNIIYAYSIQPIE